MIIHIEFDEVMYNKMLFWGWKPVSANVEMLIQLQNLPQLEISNIQNPTMATLKLNHATSPIRQMLRKPGNLSNSTLCTVHIKLYPTPTTFAERREVLRVLERFGEVAMFRSLKAIHLLTLLEYH
jgi:hypothetical protein